MIEKEQPSPNDHFDPSDIDHADQLQGSAYAVESLPSDPTFAAIRDQATLRKFGEIAATVSEAERARIAEVTALLERRKREADCNLITGFVSMLPKAEQYQTDADSLNRRRTRMTFDDKGDAHIARAMTVWLDTHGNRGDDMRTERVPTYVVGKLKDHLQPKKGRTTLLMANADYTTYGGSNPTIRSRTYEVTMSDEDAKTLEEIQAANLSEDIENTSLTIGGERWNDDFIKMTRTALPFLKANSVKEARRKGLYFRNIDWVRPIDFEWDHYEGIEGKLGTLADAFQKKPELADRLQQRAARIQPDPTLEYILNDTQHTIDKQA